MKLSHSLLFSLLCTSAFGILPLPYPVDPIEDDTELVGPIWDPKTVKGFHELYAGTRSREMELPSFGSQESALGYQADTTFSVPPTLRSRVDFWKRIYTEFTTIQAVLHDEENLDIVYGVVELPESTRDPALTERKRRKLISKFLKQEKAKISDQLKQLHAFQRDPVSIPTESLDLFRKFETVHEKDKFLRAAERIRAQIGQRDRIVQGFLYGGRYFPHLMEVFEKRGLPKELTRLPLVESAFNLAARSKVGASGVWQFMRSTGKKFLKIDRSVDERNDPITCAWAAAELLRQNYEALGSWPLAVTAYNHGRAGMARAVRQLATTDLAEIIKRYNSRTFGFASSNFFSEFLAILEVERDYRQHFGSLLVDSPLTFEEIVVSEDSSFEDLADRCGSKEEEIAVLNPALADGVLSGRLNVPRGFRLKVPPGKAERCRGKEKKVSQRVVFRRPLLSSRAPRRTVRRTAANGRNRS